MEEAVMRPLVISLLLGIAAGCAGHAYQSALAPQPAYAEIAQVQSMDGDGWAAPPSVAMGEPSSMAQTQLASVSRSGQASSLSYEGVDVRGDLNKEAKGQLTHKNAPAPATAPKAMVVYQGFMRLRVKRLLEAADEITEKAGGYVESLQSALIIVRIPGVDFEGIMNMLAGVGKVLERRVKALDVTAQYTDLRGRLVVAERTRGRLLQLLERTEKAEERLQILQEIKRLTESIEGMKSTLASLQNLVDFFTITIELQPVLDTHGAIAHRSPFPWINNLQAHLTTIEDGKDDIAVNLPPGFVLFDDDDTYRAQASDTTVLRAGTLENEPRGDNVFWADAVQHEMDGREEELVEDGNVGNISYRVYRNQDVAPRYYLVGVCAPESDLESLYVFEVFYPNQAAFDRHHKAIAVALTSFEVQ